MNWIPVSMNSALGFSPWHHTTLALMVPLGRLGWISSHPSRVDRSLRPLTDWAGTWMQQPSAPRLDTVMLL